MRNQRRPWNKVFIETTDKEGQKTRSELEAPVYPKSDSAATKHGLETAESHNPNCWYCGQTNSQLTLEQEKHIIETVNRLRDEKNKEKNKCSN